MAGPAEYFDLTPRKGDLSFDASSPGETPIPDRSGPPFTVETSQRGRAIGRRPNAISPQGTPNQQRALNKENVVPPATPPDGGRVCATKAALKRLQVVAELSQAQANARSRLCIFKSKGDAGRVGQVDDSTKDAASDIHEVADGHHTGDADRQPGHLKLTVPHGPALRTSHRSSSRELRGSHSVGEPELSQRSRGASRERTREVTPEKSVPSMPSLSRPSQEHAMGSTPEMSVRSMRSVGSISMGMFSASLVGRFHDTRPLTFPKGPKLATEARSRSHSVGLRTPAAGTPERSVRSLSVHSARSASHTPSFKLTVPHGPLLSTELRSRSRSAGTRTPSAHSTFTPERSVYSSRPVTIPRGPRLATELRSRSRSVGSRTPSVHSECAPEMSTRSSRSMTVPRGPLLVTELRSRSRLRTRSEDSVGSQEASVRSCMTPASFQSCCSVRASSVRSVNTQPAALTIPVGPLLRTQLRSCSRSRHSSHEIPSTDPVMEPRKLQMDASEQTSNDEVSPACPEVKVEREQEVVLAAPSVDEAGEESRPEQVQECQCEDVSACPELTSAPLESEESKAASAGTLFDYLPETPQRGAAFDGTETPESRAASRKQEVLAKMAQEQASIRKQRFVFSSTPIRTPARVKAEVQKSTGASSTTDATQP